METTSNCKECEKRTILKDIIETNDEIEHINKLMNRYKLFTRDFKDSKEMDELENKKNNCKILLEDLKDHRTKLVRDFEKIDENKK
jgi:hypothetical protein